MYLKKEFEKHGAVVNESHHDVLVEDIFDKEDEDKEKKELQSIVHIVYKKLIKYLISVENKKKKRNF